MERWNPHARIRQDLFGFVDLVVLDGGRGPLAVQATSGSNHAARVAKIQDECREAALAWLECGGRIEVWSWRKNASGRWVLRAEDVRLSKGPPPPARADDEGPQAAAS